MIDIPAPKSNRTGVPGHLTDEEEGLLMRYARRLKANSIAVNIGVEYGRSMSILCAYAPRSATIIGIEISPRPEFERIMAQAGYQGRYQIIVGDSKIVGKDWTSRIDLLFIDGAHEYENVLGDITVWTPHVKRGGMALLHDVACTTNRQPHPLHWEVSRAVNEWFSEAAEDWSIADMADSMMAFKRVV